MSGCTRSSGIPFKHNRVTEVLNELSRIEEWINTADSEEKLRWLELRAHQVAGGYQNHPLVKDRLMALMLKISRKKQELMSTRIKRSDDEMMKNLN